MTLQPTAIFQFFYVYIFIKFCCTYIICFLSKKRSSKNILYPVKNLLKPVIKTLLLFTLEIFFFILKLVFQSLF